MPKMSIKSPKNVEDFIQAAGQQADTTFPWDDPEFLEVAQEGLFRFPLVPKFVGVSVTDDGYIGEACSQNENTHVLEMETPGVLEMETHKQTLNIKQTSEEADFDPAFESLRVSLSEQIFNRFLTGAKVISIEEGVAVIGTSYAYAKDFIENRLANKLKYALKVDSVRCVVVTE